MRGFGGGLVTSGVYTESESEREKPNNLVLNLSFFQFVIQFQCWFNLRLSLTWRLFLTNTVPILRRVLRKQNEGGTGLDMDQTGYFEAHFKYLKTSRQFCQKIDFYQTVKLILQKIAKNSRIVKVFLSNRDIEGRTSSVLSNRGEVSVGNQRSLPEGGSDDLQQF